jgi:hypothetical protein
MVGSVSGTWQVHCEPNLRIDERWLRNGYDEKVYKHDQVWVKLLLKVAVSENDRKSEGSSKIPLTSQKESFIESTSITVRSKKPRSFNCCTITKY